MDVTKINVGDAERLLSLVGGAWLAVKGARRGTLFGGALAGLGAGLVYRGVTGHCPAYAALELDTTETLSFDPEHSFVQTLLVNCPPAELLILARDQISRLLATDEPVHVLSATSDDSFSFSSGRHWGRVWVTLDPSEQATRLGVGVSFFSGEGLLERPLDRLGRPFWEHDLRESLRRFKAWVETGEVATTVGQPHGERSAGGALALRFMNRMRDGRGHLGAPRESLPYYAQAPKAGAGESRAEEVRI